MVEAEESGVQSLPQFYTKFEASWSDLHETLSQKQNNKSKLKKKHISRFLHIPLILYSAKLKPNVLSKFQSPESFSYFVLSIRQLKMHVYCSVQKI